jgi:integrase
LVNKSGVDLLIPIYPKLAQVLSHTETEHFTIIATENGKPSTFAGYRAWINQAIKAAGLLPRCKAHGLRSAAASRQADCECTPHEIMAITGHETLAMVALYTKRANKERNAKEAMKKRSCLRSGKPQTTNWQTSI